MQLPPWWLSLLSARCCGRSFYPITLPLSLLFSGRKYLFLAISSDSGSTVPATSKYLGKFHEPSSALSKVTQLRRSQSPAPVYTILLPRFKFYVVNSVESFRFVFSKTQAFSGHVVLSTAMASICGCSAEGIERLVAPMKHDKGEKGNQETLVSAMRGVMENPVEHRAMSQEMLTHVDVAMEELKRGVGSIALRKWLRGRMTLWVTNTVYGPRNPFKDADTAEAFWY